MMLLDTVKLVETPEGVELKLTCAGFFSRGMAWFVDSLIYMAILIVFLIVLPQLGDFGVGLFFIFLFFLNWLYPVFFEMFMQGQTPGKRAMGIQVLLIDGSMVNWGASLLRNLLRTVDFLPFMYALGLASMFFSKDFRRLGDLAADTIVVYKRELQAKKPIQTMEAHATNILLNAQEQQVILTYAERMNEFSSARAEELAQNAHPLLENIIVTKSDNIDPKKMGNASKRILAIANYLMGRR